MPKNAETIEIAWTALAVVGALIALWGVYTAIVQINLAKRSKTNGARLMVARATGQRETLRVITQVLFGISGYMAMMRPNSPTPPGIPSRLVIVVLLMGGAFFTVLQSLLDQLNRRRLISYLEENPPIAKDC